MNYHLAREEMVELLEEKGIKDQLVLAAMREIKRHLFVPANLRARAYENNALSIGHGQTISQPYIVAQMTELLQLTGEESVLEIGTGTGYQTFVLAKLAKRIYTIERVKALALEAEMRFQENAIANVVQKLGDGSLGWERFAPFDRIIVTAGAPEIPTRLVDQLAEGGRMVLPTGPRRVQDLKVVIKQEGQAYASSHGGCVFVPLIGSGGWEGDEE
ncbi:protein-L-isoaspartate(D-aspartate) O-methyltransferase [bacterium]|nr:protein-L-isoaspartate(D-aspartate) O-methyltransferase [bacterium]